MLYVGPFEPANSAQMRRRVARLEEQIIAADAHIGRQLLVIASLERDGAPAHSARGVLAGFDEVRERSIAERDRLRGLLGQLKS